MKLMMDDCIFNKAKWDQMPNRNLASIKVAGEYAFKTQNTPLFKKIWKVFHLLELPDDSAEYDDILNAFIHM